MKKSEKWHSYLYLVNHEGTCKLNNKRGSWSANVPETVQIRRSDDALRYDCKTSLAFSFIFVS